MSHFSVTVCLKDPGEHWREQLSDALAPYDENLEVAPYRDYEDGGPNEYWWVSSVRRGAESHRKLQESGPAALVQERLREKAGMPGALDAAVRAVRDSAAGWAADAAWAAKLGENPSWADVARLYGEKYPDETQMLVAGDGRAYTISTRNPQAKWDYWRVGGRWGGYFPYRAKFARAVITPEHECDSPERIEPVTCDGGPKCALDLGKLRDAKAAEARELYAEYQQAVAGTPDALPWRVFADNISPENGYTAGQARTEYHSQPRVERLDRHETFKWHDDPIATFAVSEKLYVERARAQAVPGFATLTTDGRWMAPGYMGWFAVTDATDDTRAGYCEAANAYIESLGDDDWLIAVDCHI